MKIKTFVIWAALVAVFVAVCMRGDSTSPPHLGISSLESDLARDKVLELEVLPKGRVGVVTTNREGEVAYTVPAHALVQFHEQITKQDIPVTSGTRSESSTYTTLINVLPVFVLIGVWIYFIRKTGKNSVLNLTNSRAALATSTTTFRDVGGCTDAKEVFEDVIDYLKDPKGWKKAGLRPPRGILLEGPPGCGKTLLARALAGEAKCSFYHLAGSEFIEVFVGVGPARVRNTFEMAKKQSPAVIFIDELDAIGRARSTGHFGGTEERESTITQLLVSIDGFARLEGVVVVAATNRSDLLDPALLRPGRFERVLRLELPDPDTRREILAIHAADKAIDESVSLDSFVAPTEGLSGAELEMFVNEAALTARRRARKTGTRASTIVREDFETALTALADRTKNISVLDAIMIASNSQISYPPKDTSVRIFLDGGMQLEGRLGWVNHTMLKLVGDQTSESVLILKKQIQRIEAASANGDGTPGEEYRPSS